MAADFSKLSPADFEDLSRDLIGAEFGIRFEAFTAGPDGGVDGRHAPAPNTKIILQAKHYAGSNFATLKAAMKKERASIDTIVATRYVLSTSCNLTKLQKGQLAKIIGPTLQSEADIFGSGDLAGLLRKFPAIEKAHIKLWLSSGAMLEKIVHSASYSFNRMTRQEIEEKVSVYASNPSLEQARKTLEAQHIVIISGPPGVGKTTLAIMLAFAHMAEEWQLIAIRSLDDGFARIDDTQKQVFLFDDFLGRVSLSKESLAHKDSELARFLARVRKSKNARFILTTRAYIFEEAKQFSEYLADKRLDISRFLLDVGVYTRRIKARILYNHLLASPTPQPLIEALVLSGKLKAIVDHKNYNPRIIEWMTDALRLEGVTAETYVGRFLGVLANPKDLWDIPFRTQIDPKCQHLLIALYFSFQYGVEIEELRESYEPLHEELAKRFNTKRTPTDFEEALRILEGGFVTIEDTSVSFVNPSVRDYLKDYLQDLRLLLSIAESARLTDYARQIWDHAREIELSQEDLAQLAAAFTSLAGKFSKLPRRIEVPPDRRRYGIKYRNVGLGTTARIKLLLEWWDATSLSAFEAAMGEVAELDLDASRDGRDAFELIYQLRDGDYHEGLGSAQDIATALEVGARDMIDPFFMDPEELERISDSADEYSYHLGPEVKAAIARAITNGFADIEETVSQKRSEEELEDQKRTVQKLASRAAIPPHELTRAMKVIDDRIRDIEEESEEEPSPAFTGPKPERDDFNDDALKDLFAPLVAKRNRL